MAGKDRTDRCDVRWRTTTEPSVPAVTKLLSRIDRPIAWIATPWLGKVWAWTRVRWSSSSFSADPEPGRQVPLGVPDDDGVAAEGVLHGRDGLGADASPVGEAVLGAELPVVEVALVGHGHEGLDAAQADVGDRLAFGNAHAPALLGSFFVDLDDGDLVVGHERRDRLLPLHLVVDHLAHRALRRVDREEAPLPHVEVEVHELLVLVLRPEADLVERDPAVGRAGGDEVPGEAPGRGDDRGAGQGSQGHVLGERAVGHLEEREPRLGQHLVQVDLVLVDADDEGSGGRGRGRAVRPRNRGQGQCASRRAVGRTEQGHRLPEDEDEDEEDGDDDEDAAEGDDARGEAVEDLDPLDAAAGREHPLSNRGHVGGGCDGGHGVVSGRFLGQRGAGDKSPAPGRALRRYSSFASSCFTISADRGR